MTNKIIGKHNTLVRVIIASSVLHNFLQVDKSNAQNVFCVRRFAYSTAHGCEGGEDVLDTRRPRMACSAQERLGVGLVDLVPN